MTASQHVVPETYRLTGILNVLVHTAPSPKLGSKLKLKDEHGLQPTFTGQRRQPRRTDIKAASQIQHPQLGGGQQQVPQVAVAGRAAGGGGHAQLLQQGEAQLRDVRVPDRLTAQNDVQQPESLVD